MKFRLKIGGKFRFNFKLRFIWSKGENASFRYTSFLPLVERVLYRNSRCPSRNMCRPSRQSTIKEHGNAVVQHNHYEWEQANGEAKESEREREAVEEKVGRQTKEGEADEDIKEELLLADVQGTRGVLRGCNMYVAGGKEEGNIATLESARYFGAEAMRLRGS